MSTNQVNCPHCGKPVSVDEIISHQIREKEFVKLEQEIKDSLKKQNEGELNLLLEQLKKTEEKLTESQKNEIQLRKKRQELEQAQKEFDLRLSRAIDEKSRLIEDEAIKRAKEEHRFKDLENEKRFSDILRVNEELKRKLEQGSQQLQGEVLELDLEETLISSFPSDTISPVGKGVKGADLRQIVKTPRGNVCGTILWESKRTKAWQSDWSTKLKEDLRGEKADLAVIVSVILPKELTTKTGPHDGIWVCQPDLVVPVAELLRKTLIDTAKERFIAQNRGEKADTLYSFIASPQFRHQVEAIAEVYQEMHLQIVKERVAFEKIWKSREAQVQRLISNTAGMVGEIKGIVGQSFPEIKGIDLLELEDGETQGPIV